MKKSIVFTLLLSVFLFGSCTKCHNNNKEDIPVTDTVLTVTVEDIISNDIEAMKTKDLKEFVWFETMILLNNYLDEECDGSYQEIVNVFQGTSTINENPVVYKFQHFADGNFMQDSVDGFWVEDCILEDSLINIPYSEAFDLIMQVNYPKPHSKNAVLRNPLGPVKINPQWCFGNIDAQLWVDAFTGEVNTSNPAFPKE